MDKRDELEIGLLEFKYAREKRATNWFWPIRIFEGFIAGILLAGAVWIIPDNYYKFLNAKIAIAESAVKIAEMKLKLREEELLNSNNDVNKLQESLKNRENELNKRSVELALKSNEVGRVIKQNKDTIEKIQELRAKVLDSNSVKEKMAKLISTNSELESTVNIKEREASLAKETYEKKLLKAEEEKGLLYESMMNISKVSAKESVVFSIANNILSDGGYYSGAVYLGDNIKQKKLSSLKQSTAAKGNKFYGLIDLTLLGGSENGLLFSDCLFYYASGSAMGSVKYVDAFDKVVIKKKSSNILTINGDDIQVISGDVSPDKVIATIQSIKSLIPRMKCEIVA